jgi:hypothetical protein
MARSIIRARDAIAPGAPGRLIRAIVSAGAVLLIAASAALGTYFGYQSGSHYHWAVGVAFAVAALGGEILKPFALSAAFDALGRWDFLRAPACLMVALVCVTYSLAAELALSANSRGDLVAERKAQAEAAGDAKADRKRWADELAGLKASHPKDRGLAEISAVVAGARPVCGIVATLKGGRRTECGKPAGLLAEQGRAKRRAELEGKLDGKAAPARAVKAADPLASAVAFYLGAAGFEVDADGLSIWLYLVPVIFLEIGSAFGLIVARAATGATDATVATLEARALPAATVAETVAELPATVLRAERAAPAAEAATVARGKRPAERQPLRQVDGGQLVIEVLERAGRPLSNNELAAAMGVHKSEASRRRQAVSHLLETARSGRELRISLARPN